MKTDCLSIRAMRNGRTQPTGKLTEQMRFYCGEDLRGAIAHAAIEASKTASESLRIVVETTYFGHLHQLRLAVSKSELDPMSAPTVAVSEAIAALACAAGIPTAEYVDQVLSEHAFGVFHAQRLASKND